MGYTPKKVAGQDTGRDVAPVHRPSQKCKLGPSAMKRPAKPYNVRLAKPYHTRLAKLFYTLTGQELLARYLRPCVKYGWPALYVKSDWMGWLGINRINKLGDGEGGKEGEL